MASLSVTPEEREAIEAFRRDVIEGSVEAPVIVRFTADWCGPCKQLAPVIDKAIAEEGAGRIKQVVVDIDRNRLIADQFRIQSVPTVFAFVGGQPVDGFAGARPESEVRKFVSKLVATMPPTDEEAGLDALVEAAGQLLDSGDHEGAAGAYAAIVHQAPDRVDAIAGYARALLALGHIEGAEQALAAVPADSNDAAVQQARAALDLARSAAPAGEQAELRSRIEADPDDHDARIQLASALFASGDRDGAAEQLLTAIGRDRDWNEGAARAQLLKFIDAVGFGAPWSSGVRRKLSAVLFT